MKANRTFSTVVTHLANCAALLRRVPAVGTLLLIAFASPAFAQGSSDYHKVEVYGGYSFGRLKSTTDTNSFTDPDGHTTTFDQLCSKETGDEIGPHFQAYFCKRRSFNGFDTSITYNLTRYFGV